jgi:hypothetical protein
LLSSVSLYSLLARWISSKDTNCFFHLTSCTLYIFITTFFFSGLQVWNLFLQEPYWLSLL